MSAELNLHRNLADPEIHEAKGFAAAGINDHLQKNERSISAWEQRQVLLPALSYVSSMAVPPTENDGDIYILKATHGNLDVNTIAWQSGSTIRYTFSSTPDLTGVTVGDYFKCVSAAFALNNGRFVITAKNNGAYWIEVTNAERTGATEDEGAGSAGVGSVTLADWDGCGQGEWVRYNEADDQWYYIPPTQGMVCYIIDAGTLFIFGSSSTASGASETGITAFAGGGQGSAYQLTKRINRVTTVATTGDSVKAPDAFVDNEFVFINDGANDCDLFPKTGQNFYSLAANVAFSQPAGTQSRWYCFAINEWIQIS